ncbi:Tissue alpha-L-fucosidase [Fasciola gigantica]|uniref:alpha-L-fucosidase n=1 Tax=Fasciola gigantica TaxID=46835 RepID=A0A504YXU4_FASGI|nr:Tissue alpha-L-fucosidase [Fasciola gigantica]
MFKYCSLMSESGNFSHTGLLFFFTVLIYSWAESINNPDVKYSEDWDSLDQRPLPEWYDEAKVGIFVHWGVFSVPSLESEWFWWLWEGDKSRRPNIPEYMSRFYAPNFAYADFAQQFRAEFFQPTDWADLFEQSGARYVVLTAKHHEGFCNWPSETSWQWNSAVIGPRRDLVGELAAAIRNRTRLRFGIYHSLYEWFHPMYTKDRDANFTTQDFVRTKINPEMKDLVLRYQPEVFWSDGDVGPDTYWDSTKFIAWLYNTSPVRDTVVINDRWGDGCMCKHGGYYTCVDHYRPGRLVEHKWENCMTLDRSSWGFRREARLNDFLSPEELVYELVSTVAFGGNILINVGPTAWGTISPIYEERLRQLGKWLQVNGEAIYATKPWRIQSEPNSSYIWYTFRSDKSKTEHYNNPVFMNYDTTWGRMSSDIGVYAILTQWNQTRNVCAARVYLPSVSVRPGQSTFVLLDGSSNGRHLRYEAAEDGNSGVLIYLPVSQDVPLEQFRLGCVIRIRNIF